MEDINDRFQSHAVDHTQQNNMGEVRSALRYVALVCQKNVPVGREQSLALTKLEEAMFWANAGIARGKDESNV